MRNPSLESAVVDNKISYSRHVVKIEDRNRQSYDWKVAGDGDHVRIISTN